MVKCFLFTCFLLLLTVCLLDLAKGQSIDVAQSDSCGIIEERPNEPRTKVPWTAGIFARSSKNGPFNFLIAGTVLSPTVVLTVLGGVYGQPPEKGRKYTIPSAQNHQVAVGLKSTNLGDKDEYTQIADVSYILPYNGNISGNTQYHFFLFHLKQPLNFDTPFVRPVCLPVFLKHIPTSPFGRDVVVRQGGFASYDQSTTKTLTISQAKLQSKEFCSSTYKSFYQSENTDHVYCGKPLEEEFKKSSGPACVSYGSAPTVSVYNGRWFIVGVIALHPTHESSWCNKNMVYFYGRIPDALDWILANIRCPPSNFACGNGKCLSLDKVCDQKVDCPDSRSDEDPVYCRARKPCIMQGKTFECGVYGPCLKTDQKCDGVKHCPNGEDESPETCGTSISKPSGGSSGSGSAAPSRGSQGPAPTLPAIGDRRGTRCPPLQQSEGVEITCFDQDNAPIPCEQADAGTVARLQCARHYLSTYRLQKTEMTCKEDGHWKPFRSFGCEAQCGILDNKQQVQQYIVEGQATNNREPFPWHTAMFRKSESSKDYSFICGGSLIEKSVLITAAHCVTDSTGSAVSKKSFKIVLGGNSSTFANNEEDPEAQIFGVKNIWVPATYDRRTLQSDIALVQLDAEAKYGEYVRPVCYLIKGSNSVPPPGTTGKVPGYGYTAQQKISENLQFAEFPVISTKDCVESLKKTPPLSTYCAGYKNGTSVCQGDSGGGMVFADNSGPVERYVLKGLVSHGEVKVGRLCDPNNYAVFTHVDAFADYILSKLDQIERGNN